MTTEQPSLRLFVSTDFEGFWPVGSAAVVLASDMASGELLLAAALKERGLPASNFTLEELNLDCPKAVILRDGNY